MKPQNLEETIVWYYITGTFVLFLLGAQFVAAPLMGWGLALYAGIKLWRQSDETPEGDRIRIPLGVWIWVACMLVVSVALIMGHLDFGMSTTRIVKSFINFFMRTWALLAIFPIVGCLKIRPELLYRASSILCLQGLILTPASYLMHQVGVPMPFWTNTLLAKIGGIGERYYSASLYFAEYGEFRLTLFAPWAPALAFAACIYCFLSIRDSDVRWRIVGIAGAAAMVWGSGSRLGIICLLTVPVFQFFLVRISRPSMQILGGVTSFVVGLFGAQLLTLLEDFKNYFDAQRASSSRVRAILARMAIYRWQDAPVWGHGIKAESGPEVARGMPVGSHHTWFGILYVHGMVGVIALGIAMTYSFFDLLFKAQRSKVAQSGLTIFLAMLLFSFGENLETLAYLYWPGLVMLGIGLKEKWLPAPTEEPALNLQSYVN